MIKRRRNRIVARALATALGVVVAIGILYRIRNRIPGRIALAPLRFLGRLVAGEWRDFREEYLTRRHRWEEREDEDD